MATSTTEADEKIYTKEMAEHRGIFPLVIKVLIYTYRWRTSFKKCEIKHVNILFKYRTFIYDFKKGALNRFHSLTVIYFDR